jgi:predicted MPP superfamily phosphohydrolase
VIARVIFALFVLLALLGDARIFLFIMNRVVFGSHRQERSPWHFLMYAAPPLLLVLTGLFWIVGRWFDRPNETPSLLASVGAAWLIVAATVGGYWVLDRVRVNVFGEPQLIGIRALPSETPGSHAINVVYDLEVTRYELFIDDLAESQDGYRIAFLTDTHVASFVPRDFYREIISQVSKFDPHLILLGGDFVTWHRHIPLLADRLISHLRARDGIFAILGNHDYWAGAAEVTAAMEACGVKFLTNASVAQPLQLVGIDEIYRGNPDVERAFANVDPNAPCIAISHHPDVIDFLGGRRVDLLLCGHTHGGQIRFPFFGAVVVPSQHEAEFAAGFHRVGNVLMYVSRGIGSIPPVRILCRPEVATFILRRGHRT